MNDILAIILKDTYTIAELKHRQNILKSYLLDNLFGSKSQKDWSEEDLAWLKSLPPTFFQNFNKDNVYNIFSELEKQQTTLKILILYLTFEPNAYTLAQIGTYVRKSFNDLLLLDIKYDPNLIAGTALVWKGIYKDYSLRAQIAAKQSEILDSFKKYLK